MAENKPFVINDRRKFTVEGDWRSDAPPPELPSETASPAPSEATPASTEPKPANVLSMPESPAAFSSETESTAHSVTPLTVASPATPSPEGATAATSDFAEADAGGTLPPPPTPEEIAQVTRAYNATMDRLDTAIRATNPGAARLPPMSFERFVQSLYMQALLQLGEGTEPGQPAQVDLIGARQTVDMLVLLAEKSQGNLSDTETRLLDSALFELRMAFLEITQALARQAAGRQSGGNTPFPPPPGGSGPSIVR